jgi:hypothetical protein
MQHTFTTDFQQLPAIKVTDSDNKKLIEVSLNVAQHICHTDIQYYSFNVNAKVQVIDQLRGNVYAIHIEAKHEESLLHFSYAFKYNENNEVYLYNTHLYVLNYDLFIDFPFSDEIPDSIYVNFDEHFNITSHEFAYRQIIRHYLHENEEYDKIAVADFTYVVENGVTHLELEYNHYLKDSEPDEYVLITSRVLNKIDLIHHKKFFNLIYYIDKKSVAMADLFDYMKTNKMKTPYGFKNAYDYFINHEIAKDVDDKIEVIRMERF